MMTIIQIIKRICKRSQETVDAHSIVSVLVAIFVRDNTLNIEQFPNLISAETNADKKLVNLVEKQLSAHGLRMSLHDLVTCFESLVSSDEKKEKGIVYTPLEIKEYIIKKAIERHEKVPFLCDPSCGCGSFLITAAELFHKQYKKSYFDLFTKYLYGIDIDAQAIKRAKILIDLLLCMNKENPLKQYHLICADMLDPQTSSSIMKEIPPGFDCIVGNPPYVRNRNVSEKTKKYFSYWECGKSGNIDLYMPFYEIGLKLLRPHGQLTYISPNTFLQAVNGRGLRGYFKAHNVSLKIIDFRDSQVFKNVTSYTCITSAYLGKSGSILYARMKENEELGKQHFTSYQMGSFPNDQPWRLCDSVHDNIIYKIEHAGKPLGTWKIHNGLATLKNNLFFFVPDKEDSLYYYRFENGLEHKVEKAICIDIVKPNTIKTEKELFKNREKAIFPYRIDDSGFRIIAETELQKSYPYTYEFLLLHKEELAKRDKGKGKYPAWYAYGRTQGMNNFGKKLLIPYISDTPAAVISLQEDLLFYCGYALYCEDIETLNILKMFLESDVFWYYIRHTSKPYSKGFMALAKNYITRFSIPTLTEVEKRQLLSQRDLAERNCMIWEKYGIQKEQIPTD